MRKRPSDLVGAVDGEVERGDLLEAQHLDAQLARLALGVERSGHAAHALAASRALAQRLQRPVHRRTRAQAQQHAGPRLFGRAAAGDLLGVHWRRSIAGGGAAGPRRDPLHGLGKTARPPGPRIGALGGRVLN